MEEEIAKILLDINAVTFNFKKPYRFSSGLLSPIYCDNRLIISYPEKRKIVIDSLLHLIKKNDLQFDVISGIATASIPHAAWIADRLDSPMIYVRNKRKTHGKKTQIEGNLRLGQKVLIVEDLISVGRSTVASARILRQFATVEDCVTIFSYQLLKAQQNCTKVNLNYYALSNFKILINVALFEGYITKREKKKAIIWNENPENWKP
ncbi:orotate phosphoribosyltransferase [Coxiella endosymbiont of Amblyomma americanum]|uniref:orotate phosphoribosyltransferase n=1 Tax=Coxiella endosymbiont of Amblyomma americanum TaxID=325775 RepID=UPI00057D3C48|nr:orotate phosphoribosyltransferase [Coxiella endosymbiont of Amblyomma americanum]AJC50459.1 orotate phosphoribosyltransferase [Coxiella endosymbiont of Amblyomma americanum]AUJ58799.1 orotate phosphoribosyltransferase [Coxiella-like endosymbiont of Amblyomma americanum]